MKTSVLACYFLVFSFILFGQTYTPIDDGSKVHFVIYNFGIATGGDFTGLTGTVKFDPADLANADFDVSVDAATVNTDIAARDTHLRRAHRACRPRAGRPRSVGSGGPRLRVHPSRRGAGSSRSLTN